MPAEQNRYRAQRPGSPVTTCGSAPSPCGWSTPHGWHALLAVPLSSPKSCHHLPGTLHLLQRHNPGCPHAAWSSLELPLWSLLLVSLFFINIFCSSWQLSLVIWTSFLFMNPLLNDETCQVWIAQCLSHLAFLKNWIYCILICSMNKQEATACSPFAPCLFHALLWNTPKLSDTTKTHTWCPLPSHGQPRISSKGQKWNAFQRSLKILK